MDYEFTLNEIGRPVAKLSMGHEAIGRWISEEVGDDLQSIHQLLGIIQQLEQHQIQRHELIGTEFQMRLNQQSIEVVALALGVDIDEELPENTRLHDKEFYAECGILDFKHALLSWQQYITVTE